MRVWKCLTLISTWNVSDRFAGELTAEWLKLFYSWVRKGWVSGYAKTPDPKKVPVRQNPEETLLMFILCNITITLQFVCKKPAPGQDQEWLSRSWMCPGEAGGAQCLLRQMQTPAAVSREGMYSVCWRSWEGGVIRCAIVFDVPAAGDCPAKLCWFGSWSCKRDAPASCRQIVHGIPACEFYLKDKFPLFLCGSSRNYRDLSWAWANTSGLTVTFG